MKLLASVSVLTTLVASVVVGLPKKFDDNSVDVDAKSSVDKEEVSRFRLDSEKKTIFRLYCLFFERPAASSHRFQRLLVRLEICATV